MFIVEKTRLLSEQCTCYKTIGRDRLVKEGRGLASPLRDGKETDCKDGGSECWVSPETRWVRKDKHASDGNSPAKAQRHPGADCLTYLVVQGRQTERRWAS